MQVETIQQVPVEDLKPADDNLRRNLGELGPLAESIKALGLIEPLIATKTDDGLILVAGHRRLAAAKAAGLETVPVLVREYDHARRVEAMIVENLQRTDLTPVEEGQGMLLLTGMGYTQKAIVEATGRGRQIVSDRLALASLPVQIQDLVHEGEVPVGVAVKTARAKKPIQQQLLAALLDDTDRERMIRNFDGWVREIEWEIEDSKVFAELEAKVDKLRSAGVTVHTDMPEHEVPHAWKRLTKANPEDPHDQYGLRLLEGVSPSVHRKQPCHAVSIFKGQRWMSRPPRMIEYCTDPKRHEWEGDSKLKADGAEERFLKEQENAERQAQYEAQQAWFRSRCAEIVDAGVTDETLLNLALCRAASNRWFPDGVWELAGISEENRSDPTKWNWRRLLLASIMLDPLGRPSAKPTILEGALAEIVGEYPGEEGAPVD